ncbi:MAG: sigma-54-dependent transcriptional regulator [Planctomycetota bacterium]
MQSDSPTVHDAVIPLARPSSGPLRRQPQILVVDDDRTWLLTLRTILRVAGYERVETCDDPLVVLERLAAAEYELILLDLHLPEVDGDELLATIKATHPDTMVCMLTASDEAGPAVRCLQAGAEDYLLKAEASERLVLTVRKLLARGSVQQENRALRDSLLSAELRHPEAFCEIITLDDGMEHAFRYIESVAPTDEAVLILGETGTGKELMARALHRSSGREGPFVAVNVGGLDDALFADTLFGHRRGAFTGANTDRQGMVARAADGTLFLDEIGDLSALSQIKLLRLLQEDEYQPLGSDANEPCSARVVTATHRDLRELRARGEFRADLYYRLRTHSLTVPPLRERGSDIPLLFRSFLADAAEAIERRVPKVDSAALSLLARYSFPGNVRELMAVAHDALARARDGQIDAALLQNMLNEATGSVRLRPSDTTDDGAYLRDLRQLPSLRQVQEDLVIEALRRTDGNRAEAARLLGVSRQALHQRIHRSQR